MKYITFEKQALDDYSDWALNDRKIFNKKGISFSTALFI